MLNNEQLKTIDEKQALRDCPVDADDMGCEPRDASAADAVPPICLNELQRRSAFRPFVRSLARSIAVLFLPGRRALLKDSMLLFLCGWTVLEIHRNGAREPLEASATRVTETATPSAAEAPSRLPFSSLPSFALPISGYPLRSLPASRLPNAARSYRQGVHEGIDFYAPYGTPVLAVADGIVTRADQHYGELKPTLHHFLLAQSADLKTTPPDILGALRGRCVEIDHGLVGGFRWRSVYAHLSDVSVSPGAKVRRGEVIGEVGNSGTTAGVRGTRDDAHVHLEIRFQSVGSNETYLGDRLNEQQVRQLLKELFAHD